jgi:hypothetical protein
MKSKLPWGACDNGRVGAGPQRQDAGARIGVATVRTGLRLGSRTDGPHAAMFMDSTGQNRERLGGSSYGRQPVASAHGSAAQMTKSTTGSLMSV